MIGNGCTDPAFDGNAIVPFAHGKSLISGQSVDWDLTELSLWSALGVCTNMSPECRRCWSMVSVGRVYRHDC